MGGERRARKHTISKSTFSREESSQESQKTQHMATLILGNKPSPLCLLARTYTEDISSL